MFEVVVAGEGLERTRRVALQQLGDAIAQFAQRREERAGQGCFEVLPDALDGIELGTIRGQEEEQQIGWQAKGLGFVERPIIEDEDIATVRILSRKVVEKELETRGIQVGQFQKTARPGGRLDRAIQVIALKHLLDTAERFHPPQRQPTAGNREQAEATFILTEDPYGKRA